ncbi:hypothetical protein [Bosea sp. TAF32]|uniref:hypothetical protein n=1 Tax=Bosea sp. TAF32 TaxID=3237482 RepID=UPI003F8E113F
MRIIDDRQHRRAGPYQQWRCQWRPHPEPTAYAKRFTGQYAHPPSKRCIGTTRRRR